MERRLAAILAADVVGYSRLMEQDEAGTLDILKRCRRELIDPAIAEHRGRIVKLIGDGALVEFHSVVDAVLCAVAIQRRLARPEGGGISLRIGINLGDVIVEADDIYGDGINIAARLEAMADPGGICISDAVYQSVKGKVGIGFRDLGPQRLKNIASEVRVYRFDLDATGQTAAPTLPLRRSRLVWYAAAAALALAALAAGLFWPGPPERSVPTAAPERMAYPLPPVPSLAVLPLKNARTGTRTEGPALALSALLAAELGARDGIFVIAHDTIASRALDYADPVGLSESLGVRYVLDGSYDGDQTGVRVDVEILDMVAGKATSLTPEGGRTGHLSEAHAPLYDAVIRSVLPDRGGSGGGFGAVQPAATGEAWRLHELAFQEYSQGEPQANLKARALWLEATAESPDFSLGWLMLGETHMAEIRNGWTDSPAKTATQAASLAQRVGRLGQFTSEALALESAATLYQRDHARAVRLARRAVGTGPSNAEAHAWLATALVHSGDAGAAEASLATARRLNPGHPPWYYATLAEIYRQSGRDAEAVDAANREIAASGSILARIRAALYLAEAGAMEQAQAEIRKVLQTNPRMTVAEWAKWSLLQDPALAERDSAALAAAGLPLILRFECLMRNECP